MTDYYRKSSDRYFTELCRHYRLVGGITAYVQAATNPTTPFPITAEQALTHIAALLTEFEHSGSEAVSNP